MSFPAGPIRTDGNPSGDPDLDMLLKIVAILRESRLRQGLTLREMTEKMGISYAHLSRAERGLTQPGFVVILRWCKALNVEFGEVWRSVGGGS